MRLEKLDILRWIAIVLMVIFHINYSLLYIFNNNILNFSTSFWFIIWKISVILFIFIAGISFFLAEKKYWDKIIAKYIKISLLLWWIAWMISLFTYTFFIEQFIRFWIIHFFALSFLLILIFRKFEYYNILFWFIIIVYGIFFIPIIENKHLYWLWFEYIWFKSADYYPIFPYFWIMLLWYAFSMYLDKIDKLSIFKLNSWKNTFYKTLEYLWKKSLIIYLIHQPIIIWFLYIYRFIFS